MRQVKYLTAGNLMECSTEFEETDRGVIIPVGRTSEVLIPWARVLEVWAGRDEIRR